RRTRLREVFVLREESVAGMNRVGARVAARCEDLLDHQVALRRRRRTDADRMVGKLHMWRTAIDITVHGDRLDPALPAAAHHAHGELCEVGDQDAADRPELRRHRRGQYTKRWSRCIAHAPALESSQIGALRWRETARRRADDCDECGDNSWSIQTPDK